jgi:hypothetical protein
MKLGMDYMKQDKEDERQILLGEETKFQSSNCKVVEFLSKKNEQLGMNSHMKFSLFLIYYMCSIVP